MKYAIIYRLPGVNHPFVALVEDAKTMDEALAAFAKARPESAEVKAIAPILIWGTNGVGSHAFYPVELETRQIVNEKTYWTEGSN